MSDYRWMIYGVNGRSGQMIARKAVAQGLRPILAGRNMREVQQLAGELSLPWRAFEIDDWEKSRREVSKVNLLVNAAGPFMDQAWVLIAELCLAAHTHYIDLNNEVPSLTAAYTLDTDAKEKDLTLLPGLAFSPAASNFLVKHLHTLLPDADSLDIALEPFMRKQGVGANLSIVESIAGGGFRRRAGALERYRISHKLTKVELPTGIRTLLPAALGDVEAAWQCTNIPNITTHIATDISIPSRVVNAPMLQSLVEAPITTKGDKIGDGWESGQSLVWARMSKAGRGSLEGWLHLGEGYEFTAAAVVAGVSRLIGRPRLSSGALTPATALGADFVLNLPNVERKVRPLSNIT